MHYLFRLARQYSGNDDVVFHEGAYHGNIGVLIDISPGIHNAMSDYEAKSWSHVLPLPNTFNGRFSSIQQFTEDVHQRFDAMAQKGVKLSAYISEPMFTIPGIYMPDKEYFKTVYQRVRDLGGVVIADEVQTGLGRTGENFWGFQYYGVIPDIVTVSL